MSEIATGTWTEKLPELRVPQAVMIGNPSRFTNIYIRQPEHILLAEEILPEQSVEIRVFEGSTKSLHDYASDPKQAREGSLGAQLRTRLEMFRDGPVKQLGQRLVYDARFVYNGNLAHLVGHHLARLGYAKDKLGVGVDDVLVILEKNSPGISHRIFEMVGYETCETNRVVSANVLEVDIDRYESYRITPYVAQVEPTGIPTSAREKVFISRKSSRCLTNEAEIIEVLEGHGYSTHYFESIPLKEQWSIVRDAGSIVSIHGAALGYLCGKGSAGSDYTLLEIMSPGLVADIFRKTTAALGGRYICCRGQLSSEFVKTVDESENYRTMEAADFYLHPDALERALAEMS